MYTIKIAPYLKNFKAQKRESVSKKRPIQKRAHTEKEVSHETRNWESYTTHFWYP